MGKVITDFKNRKERRAFEAARKSRSLTSSEILNILTRDLNKGAAVLSQRIMSDKYEDDSQKLKDQIHCKAVCDLIKAIKTLRKTERIGGEP